MMFIEPVYADSSPMGSFLMNSAVHSALMTGFAGFKVTAITLLGQLLPYAIGTLMVLTLVPFALHKFMLLSGLEKHIAGMREGVEAEERFEGYLEELDIETRESYLIEQYHKTGKRPAGM
jgi:hypothetical protein